MKVADAVISLRPGAEFSLSGDTYTGLTWLDKVQTKPTEQEVSDKIAALDAAALAETTRLANIAADSGVQTLLNQAKTATVSQIDTWLQNNVTTLAQARSVIAAIIKVIALQQ